ncbi:MAG: ribonuclease P protein component [Bacteroidetes bacterium]|nr:ribonuclease P protein component [Bacteroidota bacterium]
MQTQSFKKDERLSSEKIIERLFADGNRFTVFPIGVVWLFASLDSSSPVQVLISVSRRKFKRAVDRNLLKRRMREAYRRNKQPFIESLAKGGRQCALGLIYNGSELADFNEIEEKIILVLQRLQKEYEKDTG